MLKSLYDHLGPLTMIWNHKLITIAGVQLSLGNLIMALTMLLFATRLSRLATKAIDRRLIRPFVHDQGSQVTYRTFAFYGTLALFVALSLTVAGIPLTIFTVVGGALAIGVGFGSQNIVNNFISGIILLIEKPIKVGDNIELDSIAGTVVAIGTRSTKIRNGEGKIFIVPNSFFLEKSVLNWSYEQTIIKSGIKFGVAYGSDVKLVENICMDILLNAEGVLQDPLPAIEFENFSESNLDFQLYFWSNFREVSLGQVKSDIRFKIDEKFKQHKIEMAFPQRDFNLKLSRPLDVKVLS
jgi:potassium efflux system protein